MSSNENEAPRSSLKRWLTWLGMFAAFFVLALAAFFTWRAKLSNEVERKLAKIRSDGYPTNAREWAEFYRTPENDVTTLWVEAVGVEGRGPFSGVDFAAAVGSLPIVGDGVGPVPPPGKSWPELEEAQALLAKHKDAMDKLHEAARKGGAAKYPRDVSKGDNMLLPKIGPLRNVARMLSLEAHVRAHQKDPHGAVESIHAILMVAKSVMNEPLLVSSLVYVAIHSMGVGTIKDLLPYVEFSEDDLGRLQADLRNSDKAKFLTIALAGERGVGIEMMRNPSTAMEGMKNIPWSAPNEDLLLYLDYFDMVVPAADEEWSQARALAQKADLILKDRLKNDRLAGVRYPFTSILAPAISKAIQVLPRHRATCRTADAGIAAVLFRRKNGRLPQSLDELVPDFLPAVPLDPFDGKPLRYRVDGGACVIYSIGVDGIDNKGVEQKSPANEIVFPLPAIE